MYQQVGAFYDGFHCLDVLYDSVESTLNTNKDIFTLGIFAALFVPNVGLVVDKVLRVASTLKHQLLSLFLSWTEKTQNYPVQQIEGLTMGTENLLPNSYIETKINFIWCNSWGVFTIYKVPTESSAIIRDKDEMLVAIDHISPSVLEEVHIEKDQKQDDTMPTSGKLSDIPSFSIALQWQIAEKNE
ncbi:hypothetical protein ACROYT_G015551 [Oculina patagonica]